MMPIADVIRLAGARQPLPGGVRQGHRIGAGPVPRPTHRLPGAADHADRPRRRLHQTRLHRRRLRQPGPSRRRRLGRRRQHQRRRTRPGLRTGQPHASTTTAAGPPASTTATKSNGSPHHHWTPAKPGSTTTTAPNDSYTHPTNQNRRDTTTLPSHRSRPAAMRPAPVNRSATPNQAPHHRTTTTANPADPHPRNRSGLTAAGSRTAEAAD